MTMMAMLPLVVALAVPVAALYGVSRLSRWWVGRCDPIDDLIRPPKWCKDTKTGLSMNAMDWHKNNSAGEKRWQEVFEAQMHTRRPHVLPWVKWRA